MKISRAVWLGLLLSASPACAKPVLAGPVVEGYLPSIRGLEATLRTADLKPYSHIALAFINPDSEGRFAKDGAMACMTDRMLTPVPAAEFKAAVAQIHAAGRKAVGTLGGGILPRCAGDWADLISPARRDATVAALAAMAEDDKLDGLTIDFEGDLLARTVRNGSYAPFAKALAARLHARHKTLSGTTSSWVGGMMPLAAIPAFDTVEVMSYDAPEAGGEIASMAKFKSELYLWLGRGVAPAKLVMGLPFYGRGSGTYQSGYAWRDIAAQFGDAASSGDVIGQMCAGCSYISYNSPATLTEKARWASAKAGGVMAWEISDDTADGVLIKAVRAGLKAPSPAPAPPEPAVPATGRPLNTPDVRAWVIYGTETYGLVNASEMPNGNALRITVAKPTENSWDIGISAPLSGAVKAGETVDFAVWARLNASDPDTRLDIPAVVQGASAPYSPLVQGSITVTPQWQLLHVRGIAAADHASGTLSAALQIGNAMKIIDLGPATVTAR